MAQGSFFGEIGQITADKSGAKCYTEKKYAWKEGGRRSMWGKSAKCAEVLPCEEYDESDVTFTDVTFTEDDWCDATNISDLNQVCSFDMEIKEEGSVRYCGVKDEDDTKIVDFLPEGID